MGRLIFLAFAALLAAPAAAAPQRVASLNLCTDELALLLAAPGQLASATFLGADPNETPPAARAKGLHRNTGRMESVVSLTPDLVLTGGGSNRYAAELARRIGTRVVDVPPPTSIADLRSNIRIVAQALGRPRRGEQLIERLDSQLGPLPARRKPAVLMSSGGYTIRSDGLAAEFLLHAGLEQQRFDSDWVQLERLLTKPPEVVVITRYYARQMSNNQLWLAHPALKRLPKQTRVVEIDGRPWTCLGPLVAGEVARLRGKSGQ